MGRQENIAVFENTKQLSGKHAKLKEAIRKSNAGGCSRLCGQTSLRTEFCVRIKSRWRRSKRFIGTGGGHLPLLHAV